MTLIGCLEAAWLVNAIETFNYFGGNGELVKPEVL